jgi:flagellar hook-associated protein 2
MNGDFTKDTLSNSIQESVNNLSPDKISVLFNSNTGSFEFYSQQYGSSQSIKIETTDPQANALGINSATATGTDVTGSLQGQNNYVFNGKGQDVSINSFLAGSPTGLNFSYTGSNTGAVGSINYSRGIADGIASVFNDMMSSTGLLTSTQNSYQKIISALQSQQAKLQTGEVAAVTHYATQFQTANKIISDMNSISSSFTSSLGNNINKTA